MTIKELKNYIPKNIKVEKISLLKKNSFGYIFEIKEQENKYYAFIKKNKGSFITYQIIEYILSNQLNIEVPTPIKYERKKNILIYKELKGDIYLYFFKKNNNINNKTIVKLVDLLHEFHKINYTKISGINKDIPNNLKNELKWNQNKILEREKNKNQVIKLQEKQNSLFNNYFKIFPKLKLKLIHNDFTSDNIIITKDKKFGLIDFHDSLISDPIKDIASFNARILMMSHNYPLKYKGIKLLKKNVKKIQNQIIKEYKKKNKNINYFELRYNFWYNFWLIRMYTFFAIINKEKPSDASFILKEISNINS